MKITFEAESGEELLSTVRAFAELVCENNSIAASDQKLLDDSLHGLKRLAKRIERLDAMFPAPPSPTPVS